MAKHRKKLIEVALPLEAINAESSREKSIRHGHPSTLHLWWARRPLAAARAVIWSSLVDDPSSLPEKFPTEELQKKERDRLFAILEELILWENSNNPKVLAKAHVEILKSTGGNPPALLDPFAGGGAIPLEAQRLGLKAYAHDLNPVAVMINKAMIEIPPKFKAKPPINPEAAEKLDNRSWEGAAGLAEDLRYYGELLKNKAYEKIGHLYPTIQDEFGVERTIIAWLWARTVKCPNPACSCQMPLISSFILSRRKGKETYIKPIIDGKKIKYEIKKGKDAPEAPKAGRGANFRCLCCEELATGDYIKKEAQENGLGAEMIAIVAEGTRGRSYFAPTEKHSKIANCPKPEWMPEAEMNQKCTDLVSGRGYGFTHWHQLFTNRQLTALTTFCDFIKKVQDETIKDGASKEYSEAITVYLAFLINKIADRGSAVCSWDSSRDGVRNTFGRQAISMTWDYAETNPFSNSSGCFDNMLNWVIKAVANLPADGLAFAAQHDAQTDNSLRNIMISTDPPYYDNIGYADLSDFFYIWLRQMLRDIYPELFSTMLVPKAEELIASTYRFKGGKKEAYQFFEDEMLQSFKQFYSYVSDDAPMTVYYAYKQSQTDSNDNTSSSGWETMLSAIIEAGFVITGTWPMRTELSNRMVSLGTNALASSIVLVCRRRATSALSCGRRDFVSALRRELATALRELQLANIAPVDLAQSAIGPGMAVFSRYSKVFEANGTPMTVRTALQIINQELDTYFTEQDDELDAESRFCLDLYTQFAFNEIKFGDADVLARAKNTSVDALASTGVLLAEKGIVRLFGRDELPEHSSGTKNIWLLTQQLTYAMEKAGIAGVSEVSSTYIGVEMEKAKALAYRLYSLSERKGWTEEAFAYNSLIGAWTDVQSETRKIREKRRGKNKQLDLFVAED